MAILLLHDFKRDPESGLELVTQIDNMCKHVGCEQEYNELVAKLPPFDIKPKGH